ncbi:hypothetical protein yfred0001_4390 [Yersinia frederiksenii ATCC 33641]|nr:hypothetical protein yfred0001_4390 [Yersinia frederiksenii ATCC 33641]
MIIDAVLHHDNKCPQNIAVVKSLSSDGFNQWRWYIRTSVM